MTENKTQQTKASVAAFLNAVEHEGRRRDAKIIDKMMREASGEKPVLWGPSIVGYGSQRYRYESGREGDWPLVGFSPRKTALVLYIMPGFARYEALMKSLGKFTTGKSCLYIKKLADVDLEVLRELIAASVQHMRSRAAVNG